MSSVSLPPIKTCFGKFPIQVGQIISDYADLKPDAALKVECIFRDWLIATRVESVLFLDIDGVLKINRTERERASFVQEKFQNLVPHGDPPTLIQRHIIEVANFDEGAVSHLNSLMEKVDAVVLVSFWRMRGSLSILQWIFSLGRPFQLDLLDKTQNLLWDPISQRYVIKGEEIKNWLKDHPTVKRFVIIDDQPDWYTHCFTEQPPDRPEFIGHLVTVNPVHLLTAENVRTAAKVLSRSFTDTLCAKKPRVERPVDSPPPRYRQPYIPIFPIFWL